MLKRALYDYIVCFRWRNLVALYRKSMILVWISLFNVSITWDNLWEESTSGTIIYLVWSSIFILGLIGMEICPLKLPKVMFLSPMNEQERHRYIQIIFWVRILAPTLIGILIGICFLVTESVKNYVVILSLVNLLICLIFCAIEPGVNRNNKMRKDVKTNVLSIVGMILSLSIELGLIFWENWLGQARNIYYISIGVAFVIVGIMLGIYLKRLPKRLEVYYAYEESK